MIQKKVARADSLYSGVAMGVTILEIALLTTNVKLGEHSLEMALSLQIIISLAIEFTGIWFISKLGIVNTTVVGYLFKLTSALLFFAGFVAAIYDMSLIAWVILAFSFLADAFGTGCLKSSFRPAYNALSLQLYGSAADYIVSIRHYLTLRIGIPFLLLVIASAALQFIDLGLTSLLVASLMALTRLVQLMVTFYDLRVLHTEEKPAKPPVLMTLSYFRRIVKTDLVFYIIGNVIETFILIYMVGMFYRFNHFIAISESLRWLGSSLISLGMYIFCSFVSSAFIPLVAGKENSFSVNCLLFIPLLLLLWLALKVPGSESTYYLSIAATTACLIFATLIIRVASTRILKNEDDVYAASAFTYAEFFSSVVLAVCMASALIDISQNIVRHALMLIIFMLSLTYVCMFVAKKQRVSKQTREDMSAS